MGKRQKVSRKKYRRTAPESEDEEEEPPVSIQPKPVPEVKIFVAEPMRDKPVTDISGIGDILGRKLALCGFDKAYVVLGQFLVLKKNRRLFIKWLRDEFNAPLKCAKDCHACLSEWCHAYL